MKFGIKLHKLPKRSACKRYDFSEPEQYTIELQDRFEALSTPESNDPGNMATEQEDGESCGTKKGRINREWDTLKRSIRESAEKTLAAKKQAKKKPWIKPETFEMIKKKRECKRDSEEYRDLKTAVRKMLRLDRNAHLTAVCEEIEEHQQRNRTKDMFATVNRLTKQACPSVKMVKSESGENLTEQAEIMNRWKNYCETLYSTCEPIEEMKLDGEREPTPTYEEVEKAIKSMRTGKAEGPDEIPVELLKLGGETVTGAMHTMITYVWKTGIWPDNWTRSTFVTLFKKGDPTVCANYRTISLISHASKVLLKVILDRMRDKVEFEVAEEQAGFRPNRGTTEHLCNLRLITEKGKSVQATALPMFHRLRESF